MLHTSFGVDRWPKMCNPTEVRLYLTLLRLEQTLRDAGWHAMPPVWLDVGLCAASGRYRVVALSGGRRAAKSTSSLRMMAAACMLAIQTCERPKPGASYPTLAQLRDPDLVGRAREVGVAGDSDAPYLWVAPGDVGTFAVISARRNQAQARLDTVAEMLDVLGVAFKKRTEFLTLDDFPYEWRVYTASKDAVVSMTCVGAFADELARWRDTKDGANPAIEVIRSLRPSMATVPEAVLFAASSPWVEGDLHQRMLGELGVPPIPTPSDTYSAVIPTWVGNPTITEAQTMAEESDPMVWAREFAAIPMPSDSLYWFAHGDITAALEASCEL